MDRYDDIVVGSGISGLTTALILGLNGRKVLLVEKAASIGGSMGRFYKKGIPFDTGFHFTGGFKGDSVLSDMLTVLSLSDQIEAQFIQTPENHRFIFETPGKIFDFHEGFDRNMQDMISYFPEEKAAIQTYYEKVKKVRQSTTSMDIRSDFTMEQPIEEDFLTFSDVVEPLTQNNILKTLFGAFSMCYGTEPSKISFANHSRVTYSLYESIARVKNGGSAFIDAFKRKMETLDIDIRTRTYITDFEDVEKRKVNTFVLNDGEKIAAENCVFTIHPDEILKTIKEEKASRTFIERIRNFEQSIGFFVAFIKFTRPDEKPFEPSVISFFPDDEMDRMFDPYHEGDLPMVMVKNCETVKGKQMNVINAFELSHYEHVKKWADTKSHKRPEDYQEYKARKIERICERIARFYPDYKDHLEVIDSASMLTFRDYLHNPYGNAYGIKQKIGQLNLFGRVKYKNTFAAGQSAMLPGIIGAMMSGFTICRYLLKKDVYSEFLKKGFQEA